MDGWNELIERIGDGEIGLDDPAVQAALRDDAFADALEEHLSLLSELDEQSVLAEAQSLPPSPMEPHIAGAVVQRFRRSQLPGLPAIAAALAAGLLFAVFGPAWFGGAPAEPTNKGDVPAIVLGTGELTCVTPVGADADFTVFRWSHEASGGVYSVEVYRTDGELLEEWGPESATYEWRPDPERVAEWPAEIEWQLTWARPGSNESESTFAVATRRE